MRALLISLLLSAPALAQDEAADTAALPIEAYPSLVEYVDAPYPQSALDAGLEGEVVLLIEIDVDGSVSYAEVTERLDPALDAAALQAVEQMRFTPARTAEGPIPVALPFTYRFELPEPEAPEAAETPEAQAADDDPDPSTDATVGEDEAVDPESLPITQGPQIVDYVEAPYPPEAEAQGLEGTVVLLVTLDDTGAVTEVAVSEPAGSGFDEAAAEAVRQMTFSPAQTEAGPVGVVFEFAYQFTLEPEVPEQEQEAPVNLTGLIRQMGTRRPVADAVILLPDLDVSTTTDAEGRFALQGVPEGEHLLKVRHPSHVELDQQVEIVEGEVTDATLWLRSLTYRDNEAVGYYEREKQEVTRRTLTIDEVKRIPGTFGDPVKVIQTLPGAARSPFGTGLLIIRGANPEDSAVYVDGVRIPIIYHLTGTTSVLSPEIVSAVDYLPGGYGAQYGRAMAGTIDVRTKERFEERKVVLNIDVLDAQGWFEGPVDKKGNHQLALGARRSYVDAFIPLFAPGQGFNIRPIYWDYQLKYVPILDEKNELSIFFYGFQDTLRIQTPEEQAQGTDQDTQGDFFTRYQSHRVILKYRHEFSEQLALEFKPSVGIDITDVGLGNDFRLFNRNWLIQTRADLDWNPHPAVQVQPGIDLIGGPYYFDFKSPLSFDDLGDPLAERDPVGFDGRGSAWSPTPFLRMNFRPLKDREQWLISTGLRYNNVSYLVGGGVTLDQEVDPTFIQSWDPRFGTRLRVFQKDEQSVTLKGSSGLYHQAPQPFESFGIGATAQLRAERSWNSSFGIEHRINQAISWDLEGFYRDMDDLVVFNGGFTGGGTQPFINQGEGYAAGFELIVRHAPVNRFFGWISYTFSRSFRRDSPDDDWYPFDFDQPHIFSAQGGYNFPFDIGLSAQVQVVSGNPFTPQNAGVYDVDSDGYNGFSIGPTNSERLPTFVQTSLRVDKTFTFKRWQLEVYLDLINVLRGVNPEFTQYAYDFSEFAYVRGLPFIPNLGIEAKFWP